MRGALEETMISLQYHFGRHRRAVSDSIAVVELTEVRHKETKPAIPIRGHLIANRPNRSSHRTRIIFYRRIIIIKFSNGRIETIANRSLYDPLFILYFPPLLERKNRCCSTDFSPITSALDIREEHSFEVS